MSETTLLLEAAAVRDAAGCAARPGAVAIRQGRIVASGSPEAVHAQVEAAEFERMRLPNSLLLPAQVNAHAHLDLSAIGPRPYQGDFVGWAGEVMKARPQGPTDIGEAIRLGLELSHQAGVGWIGDIAGSEQAVVSRAEAELEIPGTSWLECFGRSKEAADIAERRLRKLRNHPALRHHELRVELQPHAPYSAGVELYLRAARLGRPSSHLAETPEEHDFVSAAKGPFVEMLKNIGKWDASIRPFGPTPVRALATALHEGHWVMAHGNYLDGVDMTLLAETGTALAYCPVASEYFGHRGHRYRELLSLGGLVCLGTDSILCQPQDAPQPLGIWPQMRRLYQRDDTPALKLLAMATVNGAAALGLHNGASTLRPGAPARIAAVSFDPDNPSDPLEQALRSSPTMRSVVP